MSVVQQKRMHVCVFIIQMCVIQINNTPTAATMHAFLKRASVRRSEGGLRSALDDQYHSLQMFCLPQDGSSALISQHISGVPISSCASALTFPRSFAGAVCVTFGGFHAAGSAI